MKRAERAKQYLREVTRHRDGGIETIKPVTSSHVSAVVETELAQEGVAEAGAKTAPALDAVADTANRAIDKIKADADASDFSPEEVYLTEAIVIPAERPAFDIVNGDFRSTHERWLDLNDAPLHARLLGAIPAVGRIELPGQRRIPYGGTGFVVGKNLLMTNRHVAEIFASGLGVRQLGFRTGMRAAIDFLREQGRSDQEMLEVRSIRMIHPYWDMALLEVEGLAASHVPLKLSLQDVGDLDGRRVAVIGYPAFDPERNDIDVQNTLFGGRYGVKRLQPGRLGRRRDTGSFRKIVSAATHDCSTLGGNSGSAVLDLDTGEVLALHFGGRYLDTNYCVPAFELARDGRVIDAGVDFAAKPGGGTPSWSSYWDALEGVAAAGGRDAGGGGGGGSPPVRQDPGGPVVNVAPGNGAVSVTIPLTITLSLGEPAGGGSASAVAVATESVSAAPIEEGLVEVWHDGDYSERDGYQEDFLPGAVVPMPKPRDPGVLAPLLDGGDTLHYGHFSIKMHAQRRLALLTASNVTAEPRLKRPEPGYDYSRKALADLGPNDQEKWFPDPRLAAEYQLSDKFYTKDRGAFDKGHIVRRDDISYGRSYAELRRANGDTYHITNCSPQIAQFNQSQRGKDNWGDLENLVLGEAASERYCLFAGPILDPSDEIFTGKGDDGSVLRLRIPGAFWKVVVAKVADGVAAYAFVLDQDLSNVELEFTVPDNFRRRMTSIRELERRTGIEFPQVVRDNDQFEDDRGADIAFRAGVERVAVLDAPEDADPTPNGGDDEEAAAETGALAYEVADTEAPNDYRLAEALKGLRAQINVLAPKRGKLSDGWIGDAAHRSRSSDHNPWVRDGAMGVVTAIDITHDPANGCDAGKLAEKLRAGMDKRIKYIIWNKRIANRAPIGGAAAWAWRPYTGKNPHNKHVHISVRPEKEFYDLKGPWSL